MAEVWKNKCGELEKENQQLKQANAELEALVEDLKA